MEVLRGDKVYENPQMKIPVTHLTLYITTRFLLLSETQASLAS